LIGQVCIAQIRSTQEQLKFPVSPECIEVSGHDGGILEAFDDVEQLAHLLPLAVSGPFEPGGEVAHSRPPPVAQLRDALLDLTDGEAERLEVYRQEVDGGVSVFDDSSDNWQNINGLSCRYYSTAKKSREPQIGHFSGTLPFEGYPHLLHT